MKIKILIPVYNDWQSVSKLLGEINSSLADQKHEISIVIVNDASNHDRQEEDKVFFVSNVEVDITDQKQFYRRFSIPIKNRINLNKIYATIEKNIDEDNYALSNISFNKKTEKNSNLNNIIPSEKIYFNNFQKFRNIIRDSF